MAKGLSAEKRAELERVLGADLAESIVAQLELNAESLKELGVRFKEAEGETGGSGDAETVSAPAAEAVAEEKAAKEPVEEISGELLEAQPMELVLSAEALAAVAEKAAAGLDEKIAPVTQGLETLRAALARMAADVEQLKRTEDERIAEKVRHLPRATVKAMTPVQMVRPSQQKTEAKDAADEPHQSFQELGKKALYGE